MAKRKKPTPGVRATNTAWKRVVIVLGIVIGIPLISWGAAEYSYQLRVQKLVQALDGIGQNELKATGISMGSAGSDFECLHVIDAVTAIDTGPCPRAAVEWWVPAKLGQEAAFKASILSNAGYTVQNANSIDTDGTKDGVHLTMELILDKSSQPSQAAPTGMQWMRLGITATENN